MTESIVQPQSFRSPTLSLLLLVLLILPGIVWWQSVGNIRIYFEYEMPPGQIYYIFSKLIGMYAIFLLWLQVIMALAKDTAIGTKLTFWNVRFHRNFGITAFSTLLLHAALFIVAVSIRKDHFAYGLFIPDFNGGFYTLSVTFGLLAFYALILVVITGFIRNATRGKAKWIHRISMLALILTLLHCLLIGTETRHPLMLSIYILMTLTLFAAVYYRITFKVKTNNT